MFENLTYKMNQSPDKQIIQGVVEGDTTHSENDISIDYNLEDIERLLSVTQDLIHRDDILSVSKEIEAIKVAFYKKINIEKQARKESFLNDGGEESEFEPLISPEEKAFKELLIIFRKKKANKREQIEADYAKNLTIKNNIIVEIETLVSSKETIKDTFDKFKDLQEKWRNTGEVAIGFRNDIWKSYHHQVERFYDFIKINKELRDLDFSRNYQAKVALCESAESLLQEKSIHKMNEELQILHEKWKEIGPVKPELRKEIWERFKTASRDLNKKRNDHYLELKEKGIEHLKNKSSICQQIKVLASHDANSHKQWNELTQKVQELELQWRKEGPIRKEDVKVARKELKDCLNLFYDKRNDFYKTKKQEVSQATSLKLSLCEKAEELNSSECENWKERTQQFANLQEDWKKSGYLPKSKSEKIWNRFKAAVDTFYDQKRAFYAQLDEEKNQNLKAKESLLETVKSYTLDNDSDKNKQHIKQFMKQWREIGAVPKNKQEIENAFRKTIDGIYANMKVEKKELEEIRFKDKLEGLKQRSNPDAIDKEKKYLKNKIDSIQKEINQYETNMAFFKNAKGTEQLKQQVLSKIKKNQSIIQSLKEKLKLINAI